jgi:hypothetical protein
VIADLPLKKKSQKQKVNKPRLELNVDEAVRLIGAFFHKAGFRRFGVLRRWCWSVSKH